MKAALSLFVGLGGIEIVPLVGEMVLFKIPLELGIAQVKQRADLQGAKV